MSGRDDRWPSARVRHCRGPTDVSKLIYSAIISIDGYIEDRAGNFDWSTPDEEVHTFINELERPIGTYLYGRRMYETMRYWETTGTEPDQPPFIREFAMIWRAAEKIVYSRSLPAPTTARTRIERAFDPAAVAEMKATSARDLTIGGAELAAVAIAAGLIDECHLFVCPILLGGGKPALPDGVRAAARLLDEHRFGCGVVHLHYALNN